MPDFAVLMSEDALVERRSLERLALQQWSDGVAARVVLVTVVGDRAEVVLLLDAAYEYWEYFTRSRGGDWNGAVSSSGPVDGWSDPAAITWATGEG